MHKDNFEKRNSIFTKIYYQHRDRIYWYIRKKVSSNEIAEDIATEVFIKLLDNKDVLFDKDSKRIMSWLYFVARNKVIDSYRKKEANVLKIAEGDDELFDVLAVVEDRNIEILFNEERYEMIIAGLNSLESSEKEIITMRLLDELKFVEIAKIYNLEESVVKMRFYRAIEKLKEAVKRLGINIDNNKNNEENN